MTALAFAYSNPGLHLTHFRTTKAQITKIQVLDWDSRLYKIGMQEASHIHINDPNLDRGTTYCSQGILKHVTAMVCDFIYCH